MTVADNVRGAAGIRGPQKKRSRAQQIRDLARAAEHNRQTADVARKDRREAWDEGGRDEFLAARQDHQLTDGWSDQQRSLRRTAYDDLGAAEGAEYFKQHPYRSDR